METQETQETQGTQDVGTLIPNALRNFPLPVHPHYLSRCSSSSRRRGYLINLRLLLWVSMLDSMDYRPISTLISSDIVIVHRDHLIIRGLSITCFSTMRRGNRASVVSSTHLLRTLSAKTN